MRNLKNLKGDQQTTCVEICVYFCTTKILIFVSTQKGKTVYLHILNPKLNIIHMGSVPLKIKNIRSLNSQNSIPFRNDKFGLVLDISKLTKDNIDTVIQIELK